VLHAATAQVPPVHLTDALAAAHTVPHDPQFIGSVSSVMHPPPLQSP